MVEAIEVPPAAMRPKHLRQALVVHPEGTPELSLLTDVAGTRLQGEHRGIPWAAYQRDDSGIGNSPATAFARAIGWPGHGELVGTVVFVGADDEDVPGVVLADAFRTWPDIPGN